MSWPRSLLGFAAVDVIAYRRKSKPALVAAWISDHQGTKLRAAFGRLFLRAVYWEAAVLPLNYAPRSSGSSDWPSPRDPPSALATGPASLWPNAKFKVRPFFTVL